MAVMPQEYLMYNLGQSDPTTLALSTTNARTAALSAGVWYIWADVDWFYRFGGSTVTATTSSVPVYARERFRVHIHDSTIAYVAGILSSGTGTLYLCKAEASS